jgi:hypothetical protein
MLKNEFQLKVKPSVTYLQLQNGATEHLGGMIKDKECIMRDGAKLPAFLWPEIQCIAIYLYD